MGEIGFESFARKSRLTAGDIRHIWGAAARHDDTLKPTPKSIAAIAKKRVKPIPFSRSILFERMVACEPSLFSRVPIRRRPGAGPSSVLEQIRAGFPRTGRARVRTENAIEYLPVSQVLDKWARSKAVFGVTDFHYIGTRFDARMNTDALNDFNILPRGTDGFQSQDSLVISSAGAFTDSHSDDHSGSNHSFVGTKLWLLWDTVEGLKHGLEDVERVDVFGRASFDLVTFLALRSSCWILIGPGQTMFIPAHLTHKVITLERYLGLGSFHAGLPGLFDLLIRWNQLPPLWASKSGKDRRSSVEFITRRAIRRIHSLRRASRAERNRWGVPYLKAKLRRVGPNMAGKSAVTEANPNLKAFVEAAQLL